MNKIIKPSIIIGLLAMLLIVNIPYAQEPTEIDPNVVSSWLEANGIDPTSIPDEYGNPIVSWLFRRVVEFVAVKVFLAWCTSGNGMPPYRWDGPVTAGTVVNNQGLIIAYE